MAGTTWSDLASPLPRRWREIWWQQRDRWLADPGLRDRASRFALARPLARQQAGALFDLMAGFVYSQVLAACVELRLFERLAAGRLDPQTLAAEARMPLLAASRLLEAAAALDLVQRHGLPARADDKLATDPGAEYGLGRLGAILVGNEALNALVRHHGALYQDLADPVALLRAPRGSARLARYWAYAAAREPGALGADEVATYSRVMTSSQALIAQQVLDAYPVRRHRCVLDVGGGEGAFLAAALRTAPATSGQLFDLPPVAESAARRLAEQGLADRVTCHGGDFKRMRLPGGADLVTLVRVLYDHDDAPALRLLRAVREVLPAGGTVLVAEPMAQARGARRMGAAYFGIYLLAMGSGRVRSAAEHKAMLREAGFEAPRERRTALPLLSGLVTARAP
jgi:demethylspheroidene O-methyltransferase